MSRLDELRPEIGDALRPRRERVPFGEAELHASKRGVSLRERSRVVLGQARLDGLEPAENAVEVRTAGRGTALDHGESVGREHDRREVAAQGLWRREPCSVELRRLRGAGGQLHADLVPNVVTVEVERDERAALAESDQLPVRAGPRREALRADVQRLEQVRLPGPVLSDDQDDSRVEVEVERRVGAVVPERDVPDDQPASRIGMIR